ncbi:MAG: hypothetical protein AAFP87_21260, partial [Pseudomonadota bacterium]
FAKSAGFDGVEVHSANGYLLDTFLQSSTNQRTDQYGGSLENRARLTLEIIDAVCGVFPAARVGVRISPNGVYNDMGSEDNIETFTYLLEQFKSRQLAYVHMMDGLGFGYHNKCPVFTIEAARKIYDGKLICNVGYTRDSAEETIGAGHADAVAIGRPFIANPDLVRRWALDLPLAEGNPATWFSHEEDGYTTYPAYSEEDAQAEAEAEQLPTDKAPHLFQPVSLGEIECRNRIFMAPMTRGRSGPTRVPNELNVRYYAERAENTGLVFTEATVVSELANGWAGSAGIYSEDMAAGWKQVVDAVQARGAKIVCQLWHMGRAAHSSYLPEGEEIVAPSPLVINGAAFGSDGVHAADGSKQPFQLPRELRTDEIPEVVATYVRAAEFAKSAGFDGVEVHSANGYLLDTFLQ